jgi:hypothetical protein
MYMGNVVFKITRKNLGFLNQGDINVKIASYLHEQ